MRAVENQTEVFFQRVRLNRKMPRQAQACNVVIPQRIETQIVLLEALAMAGCEPRAPLRIRNVPRNAEKKLISTATARHAKIWRSLDMAS